VLGCTELTRMSYLPWLRMRPPWITGVNLPIDGGYTAR
jgi:hypothetical protein